MDLGFAHRELLRSQHQRAVELLKMFVPKIVQMETIHAFMMVLVTTLVIQR
jgi:hypothetical protein